MITVTNEKLNELIDESFKELWKIVAETKLKENCLPNIKVALSDGTNEIEIHCASEKQKTVTLLVLLNEWFTKKHPNDGLLFDAMTYRAAILNVLQRNNVDLDLADEIYLMMGADVQKVKKGLLDVFSVD